MDSAFVAILLPVVVVGEEGEQKKSVSPVQIIVLEQRGGKPPMRSYFVKLLLANPSDKALWLLLPYYGSGPLKADARFTPSSNGEPQCFVGKQFNGGKNQGEGTAIEIALIGEKGFRAFRLPPHASIQFDRFPIEAWKNVNKMELWEASELRVNGKTALENWLPYSTLSAAKARIPANTDWTNLDWDAKTQKSRTDYPKETIKSVVATISHKWEVSINGMKSP